MTNMANLLLRIAIAIILLAHSIPGMFDDGINDFGKYYLDTKGFAPMGVVVAWAIKISHVAAAVCLLLNRFVIQAACVTILILVAGIVMVHWREGWFVVGGGRNGIEYNFLLIVVLLADGATIGLRLCHSLVLIVILLIRISQSGIASHSR